MAISGGESPLRNDGGMAVTNLHRHFTANSPAGSLEVQHRDLRFQNRSVHPLAFSRHYSFEQGGKKIPIAKYIPAMRSAMGISTRFYCSDTDTTTLELLNGGGSRVHRLRANIGQASAMKTIYAAVIKGTITLHTAPSTCRPSDA